MKKMYLGVSCLLALLLLAACGAGEEKKAKDEEEVQDNIKLWK